MKLIRNAMYSFRFCRNDVSTAWFVSPVGSGSPSASSVIAMATTASEKKTSRSAETSSTSARSSGDWSSSPVVPRATPTRIAGSLERGDVGAGETSVDEEGGRGDEGG